MTNRIDRNPLTGETILVTPNRLERPNALLDRPETPGCPFCPGHESETPPEIERVDGDGRWLIRVVPNKYPVASPDSGIEGVHEVIIETPNHDDELRNMSPPHLRSIIDTWIRRYANASSLDGIRFVALFRNRGRAAGESIRHPHTQLLAVPYLPERIARHSSPLQSCSICRVFSEQQPLNIQKNDSFHLMAAPAARLPHQVWIAPRAHDSSLSSLDEKGRGDLAMMIQLAESILVAELGDVSMNWTLITAPVECEPFHWYLEISPRITGIAGYELATGSFLNLIPPETSAELLRRHRH